MILIDMNQVMVSNLMVQVKDSELDENLVRHMVLSSLLSHQKSFGKKYGEIILCYDSKRYWRREFFPYYKRNRKKDREKSTHDWDAIFQVLNKIRDEIQENLPFKVIEVDGAEADDIIATLCKFCNKTKPDEKILILSGDKDFIQLHKYKCVKQYNPILKKYISSDNPLEYVKEHVLKGDRSDGVPNFLSSDDVFVTGERQKPVSKKNLEKWINSNPEDFCNEQQLRNYHRNLNLIDLECIPEDIDKKIVECYNAPLTRKSFPMDYFIKHRLVKLMGEFTNG